MNQQSIREEISYLKAVASFGGRPLRQDGALLLSCGLVWGAGSLLAWAYLRQIVPLPREVALDFLYLTLPLIIIGTRLLRGPVGGRATGWTSRSMSATWRAVIIAIIALMVTLIIAAVRLRQAEIAWLGAPLLYVLFGAGWTASALTAHKRQDAVMAAGCFTLAGFSAALIGSPEFWLVHGLGLFLFVGLPGGMLLHDARSVA
ncbi:MAG: hypothetical protein J7498_10810 [Sphingobium sp.]|nr:hypothetical protein [Sphingobium sp.]